MGDGLLAQIKAVLYLKAACRCASWSLTALTTVMGKMKSKFNKGVEGFFSKEGLMGDWFLQSGNIAAGKKRVFLIVK